MILAAGLLLIAAGLFLGVIWLGERACCRVAGDED